MTLSIQKYQTNIPKQLKSDAEVAIQHPGLGKLKGGAEREVCQLGTKQVRYSWF